MFATFSKPYVIAGQTIAETATSTYRMLASEQAQRVYRDTWTITRVVVQVTVLALYSNPNWLLKKYGLEPLLCISLVFTNQIGSLYAAGLYTIIAGRKFRAYYEAEWAADVQRFLSYPDRCLTEEASAPVADTTVDAEEAQAIPADVQIILDSSVKATKKLRAIATHFNIRWRNAHGEGKHLRNDDIKAALSDHPEILAALS